MHIKCSEELEYTQLTDKLQMTKNTILNKD